MSVLGGLLITGTILGGSILAGAVIGASGSAPEGPALVVTMPSSIDEVSSTDLGAEFQATGAHTLYGHALYFDSDQYFWTTINGIGADPDLAGTAHVVALSGTAPFTAAAWAAEADVVAAAAGYTTDRTAGVLTVSGNGINAAAAVVAQALTVPFTGRGVGTVVGATQQAAGASGGGNSTGWVQVLTTDVPATAFRVIGFAVRRGSNVADTIRVALATGGAANADPETAVVQYEAEVGDSGANAWHHHYFTAPVAVAGNTRCFIGIHGEGGTSSIFGGSSINAGLQADGSDNIWLTDGTSGSATPFVSPVGAVTAAFNFGLCIRLIIQVAPYQSDGGYRVIGGAVPTVHDGNLIVDQTPVDDIFVSWRVTSPDIDEVSLMDTFAWFQSHAAGATNQIRFELWNPVGGAATIRGDTIITTVGVTSDTQGTGWSSVQTVAPIPLASATVYRHTIKGEPAPGEEEDTILGVWLGTAGADNQNSAGYPVYGVSGGDIPGTEREVDGNVDEAEIDFDPQVQTASPNPADGTIISPNNLPMIAHHWGKAAPSIAVEA